VVQKENAVENFVVSFQERELQVQEKSKNLLRKSEPVIHFWIRNL
jgi:hypothetical protein